MKYKYIGIIVLCAFFSFLSREMKGQEWHCYEHPRTSLVGNFVFLNSDGTLEDYGHMTKTEVHENVVSNDSLDQIKETLKSWISSGVNSKYLVRNVEFAGKAYIDRMNKDIISSRELVFVCAGFRVDTLLVEIEMTEWSEFYNDTFRRDMINCARRLDVDSDEIKITTRNSTNGNGKVCQFEICDNQIIYAIQLAFLDIEGKVGRKSTQGQILLREKFSREISNEVRKDSIDVEFSMNGEVVSLGIIIFKESLVFDSVNEDFILEWNTLSPDSFGIKFIINEFWRKTLFCVRSSDANNGLLYYEISVNCKAKQKKKKNRLVGAYNFYIRSCKLEYL
ncbi:MAG: hypothetical protein ACK4WD_08535 [Flavobacteriales bacterium]|jgi:hypothetical protein